MDILSGLAGGFAVAATPEALLFIVIGVVIGQVVGALPGIGGSAGMALLLPLTFSMNPVTALMMLSGIMYGSMYGNSLSAVLLNVPGDSASVMTAVEGNKMARQGLAGKALSLSAVASFLAGTASVVALAVATPLLAAFALRFSSPEYFLLALLGIVATASFGGGSPVKALLAAALGLMLALIGVDPVSGATRLTFGSVNLLDGIDFLPVAIGLFGVAEILLSLEKRVQPVVMAARLRDLWPRWADFVETRAAMLRGGIIGFGIGVMPGAGPTVAAFLAYIAERRFSRRPERFGEGAPDGVTASEASNNAAVTGAMAPMLSLGIPGSASTAVLLAAFVLLGFRPGPMLMTQQADLVWALIASMFIGNLVLLALNLPLAPIFASLLRIPYVYLAPVVLSLSMVGAYATTNSLFTVGLTLSFGAVGYVMAKARIPRAPVVLALVLAPLMESALRQSLTLSRGSLSIFVDRPIAAVLLVVVAAALVWPVASAIMARRGRPAR
ncbi:MAG: tripartite tricarboxylate transporter permease [Rubrimonas sp.]